MAFAGCLVIGICIAGCGTKIEEAVLKSEVAEESKEEPLSKKTVIVTPKPEKTVKPQKPSSETDRKEQKKKEPSNRPAEGADKNEVTASEKKTEVIVPIKKEEEPEKASEQKQEEKQEEPPAVKEPSPESETPAPAKEPVEHHHSYYVAGETAPSCNAAGKRTYACSCGLTYDDPIPMTDHNWIPVIEIRHHDAEIKVAWDEVVSDAWDEPVFESHSFCNGCGIDLDELEAKGTDRDDHIWDEHDGMNGWHDENVQVDTIHHEAETVHHPEEVISPAWDEEVVTGYVCSVCGTAK